MSAPARLLIALLLIAGWFLSTAPCSRAASPQPPSEYQVKAAFLYNFSLFVEWPTTNALSADSPFIIGILGHDPFGENLDAALRKARPVNGRPIKARRVQRGPEMKSCEILFISASEKDSLPAILAELSSLPILTVGESDQFCQSGGILNFTLHNGLIGTEINIDAADRVGLKISSKLLRLSRIVRPPGDPGKR